MVKTAVGDSDETLNILQMLVGPLLSVFHIYCVREEMRATPVNTLNPQRTAMIVAEFLKVLTTSQLDIFGL